MVPNAPEEQSRNRKQVFWLILVALLCVAVPAHPQIGPTLFKKPNIADFFRPVVGRGAVFETQRKDPQNAPKRQMEFSVVGKDTLEGKDAYWMEFAHDDTGSGQLAYSKMLVTKDDFRPHRMIIQQPGQPAMEFPMNFNASENGRQRREEELEKWRQIGTETITVPAGTFSCQHWQKEDGKGDVWVSDKVSPFGMVKMVSPTETMILIKLITDAKDHISGPVKSFDPQTFRQQMMDEHRPKQPNP